MSYIYNLTHSSILNGFNGATKEDSIRLVSLLAGLYAAIAGQMFITQTLQTACMSAAAGRQTKRLRELYFTSLLRQCITFYDSNDNGALATSVMERTLIFQDGMGEKLALGFQFGTSFFAGLIVALYYVWQLSLLMMGIVPLLAILIGIIVTFLKKSSEESLNAYTIAGSSAQQALGAIRTLFALGGEKREASRYSNHLALAEIAGLKRWRATGIMAGTVQFVMFSSYALGLWFGAYLISTDMRARKECNYYIIPGTTTLHIPDGSCITGGDIVISFFSVLIGGLNLGQAFPAISAIQLAMIELGKILVVVDTQSPIDPTIEVAIYYDTYRCIYVYMYEYVYTYMIIYICICICIHKHGFIYVLYL
jgi:ABC-type multidrug transport system fused ATPase/permease subunit